MADVIRGHKYDSLIDELRDVNTVPVSGNKINYGLLVVPANTEGTISSDNPLDTKESSPGYLRLDIANEAYSLNSDILKELKKMNVYLAMLCGEEVKNEEIEV